MCSAHRKGLFTSHFSQLCTPLPSPLPQGARENVSCAKHNEKNLFSYSPIHLFTFKKAAFTLAEILITLGIIGVVAALTLPTLIANHKKQTYVNQLKKVVNTIENAARMAIADEGVSSFKDTLLYCTLSDAYNCPLLGTESSEIAQNRPAVVNKYFKTISVETDGSNLRPVIVGIYKYINGNDFHVTGRKMILNDGAIVYLLPNTYFEIDVNGDKGPNIYGRDLFELALDTNGKVIDYRNAYDSSYCSTFLDNGGDVVEQNECFYYKIVSDGWKMNY